jgi:hypothetical protein
VKALVKPSRDARSVFEACLKGLKSGSMRKRLMPLADNIQLAEATYLALAPTLTLYGVAGAADQEGDRTDDMVKLYSNVLSKKTSKLRYIYDEIKAGAKFDICPLCEHGVVKTLDHYLEKQPFPIYAVAPINLVPCCSDCNKIRSTQTPKSASDQTLHPYFDEVSDQVWLHAEITPTAPVVAKYTALRPSAWNKLKQDRVQSHFRVLALSELYSTQAAVELSQIRSAMIEIGKSEGQIGVQAHLAEQADSRSAVNRNSWQAALYVALKTSQWFCNEGYCNIPGP